MQSSSSSPLDVELLPARPPVLRTGGTYDPLRWPERHRAPARALVAEHGSVLVRGLGLRDTVQAGAVFSRLAEYLVAEREAFAPREVVAEGVHSSTAWPAAQPICMHHELSYLLDVPGLLLLACLSAPTDGGTTGLADGTAVLEALPPDLVARFDELGWMLARTYNDDIGAPWTEAFGTTDRSAVESYCSGQGIEFAWQADGGLRTRQRRPAVVRHPVTGRRCWFNQVAFLSEWTMDPEVREYLVDAYGEDGLPFTTRFGDGSPIGEDVIALLNEVYPAHTVREPWQSGDLMVIDNIRTAHDREPYTGPREVLVGLGDPVRPVGGVAR